MERRRLADRYLSQVGLEGVSDRIVMMTSGPAATVGEILSVPCPRPRFRADVLNHPDCYRLRDQLVVFLEERAAAGRSVIHP